MFKVRSDRPRACGEYAGIIRTASSFSGASYLRQPMLVHLLAPPSAHKKWLPRHCTGHKRLGLDHFPQAHHHRPGQFFLHQLRVVDLAGRIIQNHDQVVPPLVAQPLMLAPSMCSSIPTIGRRSLRRRCFPRLRPARHQARSPARAFCTQV